MSNPEGVTPGSSTRYTEWSVVPPMWLCGDCGVPVADKLVHDGWHRRVEPVTDERRF